PRDPLRLDEVPLLGRRSSTDAAPHHVRLAFFALHPAPTFHHVASLREPALLEEGDPQEQIERHQRAVVPMEEPPFETSADRILRGVGSASEHLDPPTM